MKTLILRSPAKINLCLSVLGKRPDGYHEVEMLMQMVSLCDEITVTRDGKGIRVSCNEGAVPSGEGNTAWKAAYEMLKAAGSGEGLSIEIKKNIPVAAGLAGGSGNAAAVLEAANRLLGTRFGADRLAAIGAKIGMDVPFFFFGPTALARGRGDLVTPMDPAPMCWVLLVNPGFETSTAWVYKNLNLRLTKKVDCNKIARLTVRNIAEGLHNDLEAVTAAAHPVINRIKEALVAQQALGVCMSGSGPTVFGIFETEYACRTAAENLSQEGWRIFVTRTLTESPLTESSRGERVPLV
ncbi:MAG TPA: 4-(cytidine 5'-diphospho)-2-C-methyl-D-erythritol kinase [Nitrospirota bacterium]|nr:4-(cytidine 5'-diphospho)-2-C-methyl-D-erythritol kinase [Nitrospirota bacterium]